MYTMKIMTADAPAHRSQAALEDALHALLERDKPRRVVVVTGAGISAESDIPTFRGAQGYWTVGAKEYHPEQLAKLEAFEDMPREVWHWYLYRKGICNAAEPNAAHRALAELEAALGDDFCLITQNVDGLHLRAGNSLARTLQVHGNTDYMRPIEGDSTPIPIPADIPPQAKDDPISDAHWARLHTSDGRPTRPHVLWFDECYNESLYRADSALEAAQSCDLLIVIGTSGAAAIPYHAAAAALQNGALFIDINLEENPFQEKAREREAVGRGLWLRGSSSLWMPKIVARLVG